MLGGTWAEYAQLVGIATEAVLAEGYWDHQGFIVGFIVGLYRPNGCSYFHLMLFIH